MFYVQKASHWKGSNKLFASKKWQHARSQFLALELILKEKKQQQLQQVFRTGFFFTPSFIQSFWSWISCRNCNASALARLSSFTWDSMIDFIVFSRSISARIKRICWL